MPATSAHVLAVLGRGVLDPDTPIVRADDAGLTRGDGCFEGCRLPAGADRLDKLDAHLARMAQSATALALPFDPDAWRALIAEAVAAWTLDRPRPEAAVKLLLSRGRGDIPTGFVWIAPIAPESLVLRATGVRVITLARGVDPATFAHAPWLLGGVKTLSYAINMAAAREAARLGADDVIYVGADATVLEAPTSSVVWLTDRRTLHTTPAADTGILAGTTQQLLFERASAAGWRTALTRARVEDLHAAAGIWLISSVRGPVEVIELDGKARERLPTVDADLRALAGF